MLYNNSFSLKDIKKEYVDRAKGQQLLKPADLVEDGSSTAALREQPALAAVVTENRKKSTVNAIEMFPCFTKLYYRSLDRNLDMNCSKTEIDQKC